MMDYGPNETMFLQLIFCYLIFDVNVNGKWSECNTANVFLVILTCFTMYRYVYYVEEYFMIVLYNIFILQYCGRECWIDIEACRLAPLTCHLHYWVIVACTQESVLGLRYYKFTLPLQDISWMKKMYECQGRN